MKVAMRPSACAPSREESAAWHSSTKLPRRIGWASWPKNSSSSASAVAFHSLPYWTGDTCARGESSVAGAMPAAASKCPRATPRDSAHRNAASTRLTEIESRSIFFWYLGLSLGGQSAQLA